MKTKPLAPVRASMHHLHALRGLRDKTTTTIVQINRYEAVCDPDLHEHIKANLSDISEQVSHLLTLAEGNLPKPIQP